MTSVRSIQRSPKKLSCLSILQKKFLDKNPKKVHALKFPLATPSLLVSESGVPVKENSLSLTRSMKKIILFVLAAAVIGFGFSQYQATQDKKSTDVPKEKATPVTVQKISESKQLAFEITLPGIVTTEGEARVTSEIQGTVTRVFFKLGDMVGVRKLLLTIGDTTSNNEAESIARLRVNSAEKSYRYAKLSDDRIETAASETAKIQAKNEYEIAKVSLQAILDKQSVKSPIQGRVTAKNVSVGDVVSVGTPLATISKGKQGIRLFATEEETALLPLGKKVMIVSPGSNREQEGVLTQKGNTADPASGKFLLEITPSSQLENIPSGSIVDIRASVTQSANTALAFYLPLSAISTTRAGYSIFIIDQDRAKNVSVSLKRLINEQAEVEADIPDTSRVIINNAKRVQNGSLVYVQ